MIRCAWCGELFEPTNRRGPVPRYCRPAHRQRAHEARRLERALERAYAEGVRAGRAS